MNEEIDIILSRYFSGEATTKEFRMLDTWLAKSDENEEKFYQMTLLYQHIGEKYQMPAIDSKRALAQFKAHIHNKQHIGRTLFFRNPQTFRAAAAIAILLITVFGLFYMFNRSFKTVQLVAVNEQQKFELFENTEVTLFPGAEIAYDSRIKNKVQLKGKAAFTIDSKTSVDGIVIQAGETFIKDIGTVFTVDATASDKIIIVEVTEGEVLFYTNTNSGVSVKANQTAIYDADIKQFSIIVETERPPSLQEIVFHNASFRNVIDIIQARYGVNIIVNTNQFNEMMLNVDFNPDESIEYVLDIITATISAQWSKKGNNYIIIPEN